MTSCEIKARKTIVEDIKEKASADSSWNANFKDKDNSITVFFPSIEGDQVTALENAKQFKVSVEDTYSPFIYKQIAVINTDLVDGVEVNYTITDKLLKDQEIRNNIDELSEEDYYKMLAEIEEKQQELVHQIIYENPEDYLSEDKDTGFEIYAVVNGVVQRDISKLTRIQDLDEINKANYQRGEKNYRYSSTLSVSDQEKIVEQLTGMLMDNIANDLLNGKSPQIFYTETVKIGEQEKQLRLLTVKKAINLRVASLYNKKKNEDVTPEEDKELLYLLSIWNAAVFLRIQEDIVNRLRARGYKFKKGKPVEMTKDDGNLKDLYEEFASQYDVEFEEAEDITGKTDQFSDYSAITTSNKEKMSSRLRTFLSSIKSDKPSLIKLPMGGKSYRTQYVNENIVIQAINEVTLGLNTTEEVLNALDKASKLIKGREFLAEVKEKLEAEIAKGTEIASQFVDKFNQQKNNLVMVVYEKKPIAISSYKDENGQWKDVYLRDNTDQIVYQYDYKIINANRNDIANNLKEEAKEDFIEKHNLTEEVIPDEVLNIPYATYSNFRDYVENNYKEGKFTNPEEATQKLKELLETLNFELSDELYDELIQNKRNRLFVNFDLDPKAKDSVFNKSYGMLSLIFGSLGEKEKEKNLDLIFGNSGAKKLFTLESELKEYKYNISTLDGKGRNIWGYSMPSPMFREFFDMLEKNETLPDNRSVPVRELLGNEQFSLYTSSSRILRSLNSDNEREAYKENLKYEIFNTLKQRAKEGKELTEMEEAEFIASQIILHIGSNIKTGPTGRQTSWSKKFLTTPSDKSLMYLIQTPNVNISVEKGKPVIGNNNEVEIFYNYFLGEYRRAKAYQDGSEDYKNKIDNLTTYEPLIFFNFPQLNLKNDDNILWERKGDSWALRNLDEVVGTISVEDYVKAELKRQLEKVVQETRTRLENIGLIQEGVFVNGIPDNYKKRAPESVSLSKEVEKLKELEEISNAEYNAQYRELNNRINEGMTDYMVQDYAINYLFHNIEMHLLLLGDPAQFLKDERSKFINNPNSNIFNSNNISEIVKYIDAIEDNLSKRMAGAQANRMEGNIPNDNKNARIVTVDDIAIPSKIIDEINKYNEDNSEKFGKIKLMDGQEIMTGEEDLVQKLIHGKITQEQFNKLNEKLQRQHQDIEKNGFVSKENEFTVEDGLFAQPIKPVVYGNVYDPELKIFKTTYYKDSAFALYPQFTQGLELDKLRAALYNLSKKGVKVDRLVMKSAAKLGAKNPIKNVFNPDLTINQETLEQITEDNIDTVPRSKQGIQLEVPYDEFKENIRIASQQIKLIFNEISNVNWDKQPELIKKFLPELKNVKVTGEVLKNYHNRLYKQVIENSLLSILDEIGINLDIENGTYTFENLEKLKNTLQKTAAELDWGKISLEGLSITDDKKEFVIPISFNKNSKKLEKLLLSLLNKAIIQKISGRSFILATEMGFVLDKSWIQELKKSRPEDKEITENVIEGEAAKEIIKQYKSSIVFTQTRDKDGKLTQVFDIDKGLLPARRKDPNDVNSEILPAQVLVSWKFNHNGKSIDINDYVQEQADGRKFLDTSKIDPEILRILGIRIPVQGHPSMASIEIVGFLPSFMGDIIIAPQDFVAMMGSDFDIDKLYGYMYNYFYDKRSKKISKLKFDESKVEEIDEEDLFFDLDENFTDFIDILEEKKKAREKYIKTQKKKMLQNKMIDIYHTIMLHPVVYDKSLKGITEGRLGALSEEIKSRTFEKDYDYYSPFSPIKKIDEYFENKAGKLGVGVFSVNSTFLTVIEGYDLYLKRPINEDENTTEEDTYDYFTIPINESLKEEPINFYKISGANGVNNLISMFQSASVDNAKLKYLYWISVNKDTMGVAAILSSLANDDILGEDGRPLLNEDYIVYFLSQPVVKEYIRAINSQNVFTEYTDVNLLIDDLVQRYRNNISQKIQSLPIEEQAAYRNQLANSPSYTLEELKNFVYSSKQLSDPENEGNLEYLVAQYQIINKFLSLKNQADVMRQLQYLVNADSKGLPATLAESNYKRLRTLEFLTLGSAVIGNVEKVFLDFDANREVNTNKELDESEEVRHDDKSLYTLQGYLNHIANEVAVKIFSTNNNIIASGSAHVSELSSIISLLTGKRTDTYPYNLVNKITEAYVAFRQSTDDLEIQSPDKTVKQEIIDLLQDSDTNTSLATDIENFKKTEAYKSLILVKPFIESLKIKSFDGFRFVDYNPSQGLLNTEEQIVQALTELADLDGKLGTYPLFEKLIKYTFLVKIQNSPVTFKQFVPVYYQEAIGLAKKLREINASFNQRKEKTTELNIPVIGYEADGEIPIYNYVEQFFQHYPEELKSVKFGDFNYINDKNEITNDRTDVIMIKGPVRSVYSAVKSGVEFSLPYVSVYNYNEKRPNIYKKMPGQPGYYYKIPNLGRYNLDEFNQKSLSTTLSILPSNDVKSLRLVEIDEEALPVQPTDKFAKKNIFTVTPQQGVVDLKASIKASIATQYIGFGEGIRGSQGQRSSTEIYREQAGDLANTGNYSSNDVIFVSVPGKRGAQSKRKEQQDKTINEAIKAVEAGATILTDNKAYIDSSDYNEGEKRLYENMKSKGYNYSEIPIDGQVIGTWSKPTTPTVTTEVKVVSEPYGVVVAETNPSIEKQREFIELIKPQIQAQAVKENKGKNANFMFQYGLRWTRVELSAQPLEIKSPEVDSNERQREIELLKKEGKNKTDKFVYAYHLLDQNGKVLPPLSTLQPIIDEIQKALGVDMSDYDAVIGNIYLPGQNISTHRDVTESESARNYPVIVYTIGAGNAINIYENEKYPGKTSFASDKKIPIPTKSGTIYTFGMDGKGRFELAHDTPKAIKKGETLEPITLPNGTVIRDYTITLTFRRAADLEKGMPSSPAKLAKPITPLQTALKNIQVEKIADYYSGLTKQQKENLGKLEDIVNTFRALPEGTSVESYLSTLNQKLVGSSPSDRRVTLSAPNLEGMASSAMDAYGINDSQTDQEKVIKVIDKIINDSQSDQFIELAKLLKELDAKFNFTKGLKINFVQNQDSFYNPNDNSINLNVSQTDSQGRPIPPFSQRFQYEILHELVHSVLDNRLGLDQAGTIVRNRIARLTATLQSPENLQKAIDYFQLKDDEGNVATVDYLLDKLAKLRATTQDVNAVKYNSESERSVLNPLINEREFIASVLGDSETREWMNQVDYDETGSVLSKILDAFRSFFNNLIRTLGFDVRDKSALSEAFSIVFDLVNYDSAKTTETIEFLEFGTYYKFEVDKSGNVVSGKYSQKDKNNYKELSQATKKYLSLVDSPTAQKLTDKKEPTQVKTVNTSQSVSGKTLQGEQVQAFQKAIEWLYKPANRERDNEGSLTEEAILDNMFFLSGPGGSGKTFIAEIIVSELVKKGGIRISAATPTHQAKNVLKENLPKDIPATTLQALLNMLPNPVNKSTFIGNTIENIERMFFSGKPPLIFGYDYLVIDEASMIDGSKELTERKYDNVWSDVEEGYVSQNFYENPDLGTYLKEVLKLKEKLTGRATKVFLMGDIVQVVPVGSGRFQISKLLTDLLKRQENNALLDEIRRTDNEEIKKLSLAFRSTFYKLFNDNSASVKFIDILNSVNPNNGITLFNEKKDVVNTFIRLYKENIASDNPIPNYTNIIWYNNSVNDRTVNQTNVIRQLLFNNDEEINVNENLILKSNYIIKNFFGRGKDLLLGTDTKLIVTSVENGNASIPVGRGSKQRLISNVPVKKIIANVQVGSVIVNNVPITIVTPSYYKKITDKFKEKTPEVEGQPLSKSELYQFVENLINVEYGYIVNSHKIQGSKVINPIVDVENILKSPEDLLHINNMIYTAISRAVNSLYIFHPQLAPKEGKPISKLTGINNPEDPSEIKESKTTQEISVDYLDQKLKSLYKVQTNIYNDKSLSEEDKKKKLREVGAKIATAQQNLKALETDFKLSEYFRVAQNELKSLSDFVKKSETITVEDLYQASQTLGYFSKLYDLLRSEKNNYDDPNAVSEKVYVSPELWQRIERFQAIANSLSPKLTDISLKFFVSVYNQQTGKSIPIEDFENSEASSDLRSLFIAGIKSKQQFTRAISLIVTDMARNIEVSKIEHESKDTTAFRKFEQKFNFKDLIRLIEYTDPYGIKRKESTFITRNSIDYYLTRSNIFRQAESISDKKEKSEFIREELKKISYTVDSRYLFVDEYLEEMREYYEDDTINWLDSNSQDIYEQRLLDFHKEQLSEYSDDYVEYRNQNIIDQARAKIQTYLDRKDEFLDSLNQQNLSEQEKKTRFKDWVSYNSPFVLLNETFGFSKEDGATLNREQYDTAKEQTPVSVMTSSGAAVMAKPYIDYKKRESRNYLTNKARYKYQDGQITGFYDPKYSEMEQEMLQRELRISELEDAGDIAGAEKEKENLILWDYLQFAQERQKYYLDKLPYYIKKELKWFNLVDVPKEYGEQFSDKIEPVMSFSNGSITNFMQNDLLETATMLAGFAWDPVVKKVSERHIKERKKQLDFVTDSVKLSYDPSGFNNNLNKLGAGGLRTNDVFNYFAYLRMAAIQFEERSKTEELIKISQFLITNSTQNDKSSSVKIKLTKTELAELNWHINTKLYGVNKRETYEGTDYKKIVGEKGFMLTKNERDKRDILVERIAYLESIIPTVKNQKKRRELINELNSAKSQLEGLKREINRYTFFNTYSTYVSLKRLSFGIFGRFLDYASTGSAAFRQALDGRLYGTKSYAKAWMKIKNVYGVNALSSLLTAGGVISLNPLLAAGGVALRFAGGVYQQATNKKEVAKINQILYRLGALNYMTYQEDDNISTFVTKTNITDEAKAAIKNLSPFSTLSQVEILNKGVPALALMYETKLKDLNGNERSLIEAFDVDDDLNLIWKESEFGSQKDAGFDWYKGFKMKQVINKATSAQTLTGGDYDPTTSKYSDAKIRTRLLTLLRRFFFEFAKFRVGGDYRDESTGILYTPMYTAAYRSLPFIKKQETKEEEISRKIARKQIAVDAVVLLSLNFIFAPLIRALIASVQGDDDDDKKDTLLEKLFTYLDIIDNIGNYALNAIEGHIKNESQLTNPNISRGRISTGSISPVLSDIMDLGYFTSAIYQAFSEEGDIMSHREMIGKGLAPRREVIKYKTKRVKNPKTGKKEKKKVPVYKPERIKGKKTTGKYSKDYEPQSRFWYRFKRLIPFMNLYSNYQRSNKKKIETIEKIREEKMNE